MLQLLLAALPALTFLMLPFLASALAAVVCGSVHLWLKRSDPIGVPAGEWLTERAAVTLPAVEVAVAPEIAGSMDGYWPKKRVIGLSPKTWLDRTPAGRAIAAHELGHALAWDAERSRASRLLALRHAMTPLSALVGAGLLVGALMNDPRAVAVGAIALVGVLVCQFATLLDEGDASLRATAYLEHLGLRSRGTDAAMLAAFGVYLAPALTQVALLASLPWVWDAFLADVPMQLENSPLGLWSVLLLAPFMLLRAAQVVTEARTPPPITNEFRLNWTMFQERSWEFHSGVVVALWLAFTYDKPVSSGLSGLFVLGILPAMGPLAALGRFAVVLPLVFLFAFAGLFQDRDTGRTVRAPKPIAPLALVETDPTLTTRLTWLFRISWLPLLVVLMTRAVSGW